MVFVGTAGWSIPREARRWAGAAGSHLRRYGREFACVEINSSFYRPHRRETYVRWASAVPPGFKFAIKCPREITHERKLRNIDAALTRFLFEISGLGRKRGPVLVQLPPSFEFDRRRVMQFFTRLRTADRGPVVCEPRHPSWFTDDVDQLLRRFRIARVAADPIRGAGSGCPAGWTGIAYFRLHGSPRMYWSRYHPEYIRTLASTLRLLPSRTQVWCIFDNTAASAAIQNAHELARTLQCHGSRHQ